MRAETITCNCAFDIPIIISLLTPLQKKYPIDFDDELKIGDVRYDNMTKITIKVNNNEM